jgi:hypothetical protein
MEQKVKQIENLSPFRDYIDNQLYPIVLGPGEFALVTGTMLNEINKELKRIINYNTNPFTIKIDKNGKGNEE